MSFTSSPSSSLEMHTCVCMIQHPIFLTCKLLYAFPTRTLGTREMSKKIKFRIIGYSLGLIGIYFQIYPTKIILLDMIFIMLGIGALIYAERYK